MIAHRRSLFFSFKHMNMMRLKIMYPWCTKTEAMIVEDTMEGT